MALEHRWRTGEVFVFGSNKRGIHGAGAARDAWMRYGAIRGIGEGRMGSSYALPTCSEPCVALPMAELVEHVERFLAYARRHPKTRFFLTRVGCGIAGFTDAEVAPLFAEAPANVRQPPEWSR